MELSITDTHVHIWDLQKARYEWLDGDTSLLNRTYGIEEISAIREAVAVTKGILVQAANHTRDTELMLETAENTSWIAGVVGWLPLLHPAETERLLCQEYNHQPYFKGVRHLIHTEANAAWLLQEEVIESLQIIAKYHLPFDLVGVIPQHIETALKVAEKVPDLKMVFDHLNQPPIAAKELDGSWSSLMRAAAANKNFYAKISGLGTASGNFQKWTGDELLPYIAFALEQFGEDRCFCGGDWPVSLLAGSYKKTWDTYKSVLSGLLNEAGQQKVFHINAQIFYDL